MKRTGTLVAGAVMAVIATVPDPANGASVTVVKLQNFDIRPDTVRINPGGAVEWRFLDRPSPHNVTSRGRKRFRSSPSKLTGTYRVRFNRSGTYRYVCTIHFNMRGKIVVN